MRETWRVRKPEARSSGGVVSTQHYLASEAGARVLADGGNAVDAAVTAGVALGAQSDINSKGEMQCSDKYEIGYYKVEHWWTKCDYMALVVTQEIHHESNHLASSC